MMRNSEDAEDMLQESMLKSWRKLSSFKKTASFSTWLHKIAVNTCLDAIRKRKDNKVSMEVLEEKGRHLVDDTSSDFAEHSIQKEMIQKALYILKKRDRVIIVLKDIQGYSYEEISVILKCPMGTVRSRLSRARSAMVEVLGEMEQNNEGLRHNRRKRKQSEL